MNREVHDLTCAAIEGRLSPEMRDRLETLIRNNPQALQQYLKLIEQHANLSWAVGDPTHLAAPIAKPKYAGYWLPLGLLAASIAAIASSVVYWSSSRATAIATLEECKACQWGPGTLPTEPGVALGVGRLQLIEGMAKIRFASGVLLSLEAPAEVELQSAKKCALHSGRAVAKVPPSGVGFVVDTPSAQLTDYGTEFGVNVRDGKISDVQVFTGRVDVRHRNTGQTQSLLTGGNRRFTPEAISEFDPTMEPPRSPALPPVERDTRTVTISTANGQGKDAYVQIKFPLPAHTPTLLMAKNSQERNFEYFRKIYLGFDLHSLQGRPIRSAQLTMTLAPTGLGFASEVPDAIFKVYGLTDQSLDDWAESRIRWANAPANRPGGDELNPAQVRLLGTFEVAQGVQTGPVHVATTELAEFLSQDTNRIATLIVVRETKGSGRNDLVHGFASRYHPTLPPPTLKLVIAE